MSEPTKKRSIFDITEDFWALDDILAESGGDVGDDAAVRVLDEFMGELETDLEGKVDGYCSYIVELESRAAMRKAELDRLRGRVATDTASAKGLKARLQMALDALGRPKVETQRFKVGVQNNGGKLPLILASDNPETIPPRFVKMVPTIDTDAIRKAIEAGDKLDFARLGHRGRSLRIR